MNHLPTCCASCSELEPATQTCKLLSRPTDANRRALLTMPCDVPRLVRQRFRGHGEEIASQAISRWVDGTQDPEAIAWSYGDAPRDARVWLSSWPFRYLARGDVQAKLAKAPPPVREPSHPNAPPNPVLFARVAGALARVAAIDPLGFSMMVDSFNGQFDLATWRAATGADDATNLSRRLVALYRFGTIFFDALSAVREPECRAALIARQFTGGEPTDQSALASLRDLLGKPHLRMSEMRGLYAQGVNATFAVLRADDALGRVFDVEVERGMLRALRVDERADIDLQAACLKIIAELAPKLASGGSFGADDHAPLERLGLLAAASLDAPDVAPIARHLFICRDGRCPSVLRWEVGGREAVRAALSGPRTEPPPNSIPIQAGPASPHVVYCRDELWVAFTQLAAADNKTVDEVIDVAMSRYRAFRDALALAPPAVPTELASSPPLGVPLVPSLVVPNDGAPPSAPPELELALPSIAPLEETLAVAAPAAAAEIAAPPPEPIASPVFGPPPIPMPPGDPEPVPVDRNRATRIEIVVKAAPEAPLEAPKLEEPTVALPPARAPLHTLPVDASKAADPAPALAPPTYATLQGLEPLAQSITAAQARSAVTPGKTLQGLGAVEVPPLIEPSAPRPPMGTDPLGSTPAGPASGDDRATPILPAEPPKIPDAPPVPAPRGTIPLIAEKPTPPKGETLSLVMEVPTHHKPSDFDPLPKIIINADAPTSTAPPAGSPSMGAPEPARPSDGQELSWSFPPMAPPKDVTELELKTPVRMPVASLPSVQLDDLHPPDDVHERITLQPGQSKEPAPNGPDAPAEAPVAPTTVDPKSETPETAGAKTPPLGTAVR